MVDLDIWNNYSKCIYYSCFLECTRLQLCRCLPVLWAYGAIVNMKLIPVFSLSVYMCVGVYKTSDAQHDCSPPAEQCPASSQAPADNPANLLPFFQVFLRWCYMVWNNNFFSLSQLSLFCPLPASCAPSSSLIIPHWQDSTRSWKAEMPLVQYSSAQQQLEYWYIVTLFFSVCFRDNE